MIPSAFRVNSIPGLRISHPLYFGGFGASVGAAVGSCVGAAVGAAVGMTVGATVGTCVGTILEGLVGSSSVRLAVDLETPATQKRCRWKEKCGAAQIDRIWLTRGNGRGAVLVETGYEYDLSATTDIGADSYEYMIFCG